MARKPKTPRAATASSPAEVRVMMTAAFTYQLGPSARRTLPAGWSGMVPAAIAIRVEAEKAGARVTVEEEEGDAAATKPPKAAASVAPKPAATIPAEPSPAATSAVDAKPSASAATADSAKEDQDGASQSPAAAAATSPAAPAAAEPGTPAAPAAPEAGGASVDPKVGPAEGNQTSVSAAAEAGTAPEMASGSTGS
ncbi:hypothetical protein K7H20_24370 [Salipiger manganoxidans]|uniref:hypothetical protein n=1 Tax=Salipiger marinus TaxID=555512 RepID=UPI001E5FCB5D|nr:hypothetical protein [Salipiger manganoxidans]MCD1621178.1 hypothetical protein [Salipiger manganoxidans]